MDIISEDNLEGDFVPYFIKVKVVVLLHCMYGRTYHLHLHHHISPYFTYYIQFYSFTFFYVKESNARSTDYWLGLQVYRSTGLQV